MLIIDANRSVVECLATALTDAGFAVGAADSGSTGLDQARLLRPDVVILEVALPGIDGFGVLRALRADGIDAPVLFLTTHTAVQDKVTGFAVGADDYITKPFNVEEVLARLRVVLRRSGFPKLRGIPDQAGR